MQRGELFAELERLAAEAKAARANLDEIAGRIKRLREQLDESAAATGVSAVAAREPLTA